MIISHYKELYDNFNAFVFNDKLNLITPNTYYDMT